MSRVRDALVTSMSGPSAISIFALPQLLNQKAVDCPKSKLSTFSIPPQITVLSEQPGKLAR